MLPISIGIVAWKSDETLDETLKTYVENDFFKLISDSAILFQEVTEKDRLLAKKYGLRFIGLDDNVGIGRAMQILAEQALSENFIFLEQDWQIVEDYNTTKRRLIASLDLLEDDYKCIRLRSRKNPGHPVYSMVYKDNELNHYDENTGLISPHLFDCVHWINEPNYHFPDQISKHKYHYTTTSRWSNWTNNPCLFKKDFLLEVISPFVSDKLLEPTMSKWWAEQNYHVAWGEGLFKHVDFKKWSDE
jgi:hypothetical protein